MPKYNVKFDARLGIMLDSSRRNKKEAKKTALEMIDRYIKYFNGDFKVKEVEYTDIDRTYHINIYFVGELDLKADSEKQAKDKVSNLENKLLENFAQRYCVDEPMPKEVEEIEELREKYR